MSASDLADPAAEVTATTRGFAVSTAPVQLVGTDTLLDNLSIRRLARPRTEPGPGAADGSGCWAATSSTAPD